MLNINSQFQTLVTESVSEGHPDKICDQIAEKILDFCLKNDEYAKVAIEVLISDEQLLIGGQIKSQKIKLDNDFRDNLKKLTFKTIKDDIKYSENSWKKINDLNVLINIEEQSTEINNLVEKNHHSNAGDNCISFGYADNSSSSYFPFAQLLANQILKNLQEIRKNNVSKQKILKLAPDSKIQIFCQGTKIIRIVLCQQFEEKINQLKNPQIKQEIRIIIDNLLNKLKITNKEYIFDLIDFHIGGPVADTGLTGRKLLIDTYGTFSSHGGGSFAGKDPTKTDKSLALFARFIAKHLIATKLVNHVKVQLSSTIGENSINNFAIWSDQEEKNPLLMEIIQKFFVWNIEDIIQKLKLRKTNYFPFASYGYFGRLNGIIPEWEKLTYQEQIKNWLQNKTK